MVQSPDFIQFKSSIHIPHTRSEILHEKRILFSDLRLFTTVVVTEIIINTAYSWHQIDRNLGLIGVHWIGFIAQRYESVDYFNSPFHG